MNPLGVTAFVSVLVFARGFMQRGQPGTMNTGMAQRHMMTGQPGAGFMTGQPAMGMVPHTGTFGGGPLNAMVADLNRGAQSTTPPAQDPMAAMWPLFMTGAGGEQRKMMMFASMMASMKGQNSGLMGILPMLMAGGGAGGESTMPMLMAAMSMAKGGQGMGNIMPLMMLLNGGGTTKSMLPLLLASKGGKGGMGALPLIMAMQSGGENMGAMLPLLMSAARRP